uniref:Uncharacterized protein n=1 Tax=uncultured bacterium contig00051 TaxID=1181535 RepID=A0A806KSG5_9BACT|nr:hypothetical protein [uncultured bacterium contig00051]
MIRIPAKNKNFFILYKIILFFLINQARAVTAAEYWKSKEVVR